MHEATNIQQQNNAIIKFDKFQEVIFTTSRFNIPGISTTNPIIPGPRFKMVTPPTAIEYEAWNLMYRVSEGLDNYVTLVNWLQDLESSPGSKFSDASVIVLDNNKKPKRTIKFINVIPVAVSALDFSYMPNPTDNGLYNQATFMFHRLEFN